MYIAKSINQVQRLLLERSKIKQVHNWQGNSDFKGTLMRVLHNVTLIQPCPVNLESARDYTLCDEPWAEAHFQERIYGLPTNPGETYKYWPYHTNLDKSKYKEDKFSHTYQERFWPKFAGERNSGNKEDLGEPLRGTRYNVGDLKDLITQLGEEPSTRQAYLPIWFPEDTGAQNRRVPCTIGYYFYIDEGEINCNYTIRSCDLYRHFRNDVYFTIRLLQYIHETINNKYNLDIKLGKIRMDIYNLHLFVNDAYALIKREQLMSNHVFYNIKVKDIWQKEKE